jgi:UDP-N-acetylmuramate dehydrogenase
MSLADDLALLPDLTFHPDHDLTRFTTMRLASRGDLVEVRSVAAVRALLPLLRKHRRSYLVVGWGANQILPPVCEDLIIYLDLPFDPGYLDVVRDRYRLPASVGLNQLSGHAIRFGLAGWEVFTGIPASLGGAIFMNAGTNLGEIGPLVSHVELVTPEGELREEAIGPASFSYRHNHFVAPGEVIVGATFVHRGIDPAIPQKIRDYLEYRKKSQPLATRNCGCVFKNPHKELPAGKLIDLLGLKGLVVGGLRVSPKHANFVENTGASTWDEFATLVGIIKASADEFYGIEFELEVKIPYD